MPSPLRPGSASSHRSPQALPAPRLAVPSEPRRRSVCPWPVLGVPSPETGTPGFLGPVGGEVLAAPGSPPARAAAPPARPAHARGSPPSGQARLTRDRRTQNLAMAAEQSAEVKAPPQPEQPGTYRGSRDSSPRLLPEPVGCSAGASTAPLRPLSCLPEAPRSTCVWLLGEPGGVRRLGPRDRDGGEGSFAGECPGWGGRL